MKREREREREREGDVGGGGVLIHANLCRVARECN